MTSIKIDFDDQGNAAHLRVTRDGAQTLAPGGTHDLTALHGLLDAVAQGAGVVEVAESVEAALAASQVTLVAAERVKRREALLDAKLDARRSEVAALESREAELRDALAITDKQAVLDALTRDVGDVVAILDKQATIASLDAQIATKTAELSAVTETIP